MTKKQKRRLNILKREIQKQKSKIRKKIMNQRELRKLIIEQKKDQLNNNVIHNKSNSGSNDILDNGRRLSGSGFKNQ
jgi:aromatic ring-opening dioxygenase LigB subunit